MLKIDVGAHARHAIRQVLFALLYILVGDLDSCPAATLDETWQKGHPAKPPSLSQSGRRSSGPHAHTRKYFPDSLTALACPLGLQKSSLGPDFIWGSCLRGEIGKGLNKSDRAAHFG